MTRRPLTASGIDSGANDKIAVVDSDAAPVRLAVAAAAFAILWIFMPETRLERRCFDSGIEG